MTGHCPELDLYINNYRQLYWTFEKPLCYYICHDTVNINVCIVALLCIVGAKNLVPLSFPISNDEFPDTLKYE